MAYNMSKYTCEDKIKELTTKQIGLDLLRASMDSLWNLKYDKADKDEIDEVIITRLQKFTHELEDEIMKINDRINNLKSLKSE